MWVCTKSFGSWPFLRPDNSYLHPLVACQLSYASYLLETKISLAQKIFSSQGILQVCLVDKQQLDLPLHIEIVDVT